MAVLVDSNVILDIAIVGSLALQLIVLAVPPVMRAFDTVPVSAAVALWVGASMLTSWGLAEAVTRRIWKHDRQ